MYLNTLFLVLFTVIVVPAVIILYGVTRWQSASAGVGNQLEAQRRRIDTRTYELAELHQLPAPVQKYFRSVLPPGQPTIAAAEIGQRGRFNAGRRKDRWVRFEARQTIFTDRPGFYWDARLHWYPLVTTFAHNIMIMGEAMIRTSLFGLVPLERREGIPELADAEMMRFLAEAVWYPTKLLPSQGVLWEAIDDQSAQANFADGSIEVALVFSFDANGLVRSVRSRGRHRLITREMAPAPWEYRFWDYREHSGMMIPTRGEVAWITDEQRHPYREVEVTDIMYKFTP